MGHNILFISGSETFIVKGIEAKLKGIGANPVYSSPERKEVEEKAVAIDLIILYMDEALEDSRQTMEYLADITSFRGGRIIVIGTRAEYETVLKWIPRDRILAHCDRPLDTERFLDTIESFYQDVKKQVRRKSVLIVDDDVQYMGMIMDWLKDKYRVLMANSGMQAITTLATSHVDLILLDYEMPVTTGPQVLEMIKSEPNTAGIPVFFLTGNGEKESILKVLALKPAGYLLKTIEKQGLLDTLNKYFLEHPVK